MENLLSATTSLAEILEAGNLPPSLPQVERSPCPSPLNIHHHPSPSLYSCFKYPSLLSKGITPLHLLKPSKLTSLLSPIPRTLKLRSHPSLVPIGMERVTSPKLHRVNLNGRLGFTIDSAHAHTAQSPLTGPCRDGQGDKSKATVGSTSAGGLDAAVYNTSKSPSQIRTMRR